MCTGIRRLTAVAAFGAAFLAPLAQAAVIDFEDPSLTGLYFSGDPFVQSGFRMTQEFGDSGIVDVAQSLGPAAPTGNRTQFYANTNDGGLLLESANGRPFSLDGFRAAYVPLIGSASPGLNLSFVAFGTTMTNANVFSIFNLGNTTSTTQGSPFLTFAGAAFSQLTNLASVEFFTCVVANGQACAVATRNNGQFALDDIRVTAAVPEPETYALMALGLACLAGISRRRRGR